MTPTGRGCGTGPSVGPAYPEGVREWWRERSREGQVSLSMVALVVSLLAALSLGLTSWVPRVLERDIGVADVAPGLLEVAQDARGVQSLGAGLSVALYDSGLPARPRQHGARRHGDPRRPGHGRHGQPRRGQRPPPRAGHEHAHARADRRRAPGQGHRPLQRRGPRRHDEQAAAHRLPADRRPDPDGCRGARRRRGRHPPRLAARDPRHRPGPARAQPARARLLGRPQRRRAAGLHLGARHRRVDRARCRCRGPSTCARTAGSRCTSGRRGPWSPSRTRPAMP